MRRLLVIALWCCAGVMLGQDATGFHVEASKWPTADFPIGTPGDVILGGMIRNVSRAGVTYRPFVDQSKGYGQVRKVGTEAPACETPRHDVRFAQWEEPFKEGTGTPYRYSFGEIACEALEVDGTELEARFCLNPEMFRPVPEPLCSAWVRFRVDRKGAALRTDDNTFRAQVKAFEVSGDHALQVRLLGALQLRASREQPTEEQRKAKMVGVPDEKLATMWLEFVRSEDAVMAERKPKGVAYMNMPPPPGCEGTRDDPHPCARTKPEVEAEYQRAVRRNEELIAQSNAYQELNRTAISSVADFGMWMGEQYRRNKEARETLYVQAAEMGLPTAQVGELKRFLEFVNVSE